MVGVVTRFDPRLRRRLWEHLSLDDDGCWVWDGLLTKQGYGRIFFDGSHHLVHRFMWKLLVDAALPDELEIDHLCLNKPCANPGHVEPVTGTENTRRYHDIQRSKR